MKKTYAPVVPPEVRPVVALRAPVVPVVPVVPAVPVVSLPVEAAVVPTVVVVAAAVVVVGVGALVGSVPQRVQSYILGVVNWFPRR